MEVILGALYGYLHAPVSNLAACLRPTTAGERLFFLHCNSVASGHFRLTQLTIERLGATSARNGTIVVTSALQKSVAYAFLFVKYFLLTGRSKCQDEDKRSCDFRVRPRAAFLPITAIPDRSETYTYVLI